MLSSSTLAVMDIQTLTWLVNVIDSCPDNYSLNGVLVTVEWFYEIDNDFKSYSYLLDRINEKSKML